MYEDISLFRLLIRSDAVALVIHLRGVLKHGTVTQYKPSLMTTAIIN